jgi:predicted naringenin-chalcone synthase
VPQSTNRVVRIIGIGKSVPKQSICQRDAIELGRSLSGDTEETARLLPLLYQRTRVDRRALVLLNGNGNGSPSSGYSFPAAKHAADLGPDTQQRMVTFAKEAPKLALTASRLALDDARVSARRIGHVISVSCTGFFAPGFDIELIKNLKLSNSIHRTQIGFMGCHGAFNGFRVASALAREQPDRDVLLCSVELCSVHAAYGDDPERIIANALFADGASAAVFSANGHQPSRWRLAATGSRVLPDSEDAMTWKIGNHGFEMHLSPEIPGLIGAHLKPWLTRWLKQQGLTLKQVKSWAIHPGGPRVLDAVESSLGISRTASQASRSVLGDYGNMSSATILFILNQLYREDARTPCVALGFGPGLVAESALFL